MPQPRKEQIKNLRAKYFRFGRKLGEVTNVLLTGGPVQSLFDQGFTTNYTRLLQASKTSSVGGTYESIPAVLEGKDGPYNIPVGGTILMSMSDVNGGNSFQVVFQASDFVSIGGSQRITVAAAAKRINTALATFSIPQVSASNVNGRLVIRSSSTTGVTSGSKKFIIATDVTSGVLSALGLSTSGTVTVYGKDADTRGIVTESFDGRGGFVRVKPRDVTTNGVISQGVVQIGPRRYSPKLMPGKSYFGRIRRLRDGVHTGVEIEYLRSGPKNAEIVTSRFDGTNFFSNFSSITAGQNFTIEISFDGSSSIVVPVIMPAVTTPTQVVNAINAAYSAHTASLTSGISYSKASVVAEHPGVFSFPLPAGSGSFYISFNGGAPIHIQPESTVYSVSGFVTLVNNAISVAGQSLNGEAISIPSNNSSKLVIQSKSSAVGSSVLIAPGGPDGTFTGTLDILRLSPGLYQGSTICELYGQDEIRFFCPSQLAGSYIAVNFVDSLADKFGLPPNSFANVSTGEVPVSIPDSIAIIPEVVEFSEEDGDHDPVLEEFDQDDPKLALDPTIGVANYLANSILGEDGKIRPEFMPGHVGRLTTDSLRVGTSSLGTTNSLSAGITVEQNKATALNLILEATTDTPASDALVRIYQDGSSLVVTQNAKRTPANTWVRDLPGSSSKYSFNSGTLSLFTYPGSSADGWSDGNWQNNTGVNPSGSAVAGLTSAILTLGENLKSSSDSLKPRVNAPVSDTTKTLIYQSLGATGIGVRIYWTTAVPSLLGTFELVTNAYWGGTTWTKDVNGLEASLYLFSGTEFRISKRNASDDTPWSVFPVDKFQVYSIGDRTAGFLGDNMDLGTSDSLPMSTRLSVPRVTESSTMRTLVFESPGTGSPSLPIRTYYNAYFSSGYSFGQGKFETVNARWNETTKNWVQDVPSKPSHGSFFGENFSVTLYKDSGSAPWQDDNWSRSTGYNAVSKTFEVNDSVFRFRTTGAFSNPSSATAVLSNAIYPKSVVKAWARLSIVNSTGTYSVVDGFNVSSVTKVGDDYHFFLPTPLVGSTLGSKMCVVTSIEYTVPGVRSAADPSCVQSHAFLSDSEYVLSVLDFNGALCTKDFQLMVMVLSATS